MYAQHVSSGDPPHAWPRLGLVSDEGGGPEHTILLKEFGLGAPRRREHLGEWISEWIEV